MDQRRVQEWLDGYVAAWEANDPERIRALFTEDAVYQTSPYEEPTQGREAIVKSWLEDPDDPGTWRASYEPIVVQGDTAVAHGRSTYFATDTAPEREWANVFVLRFDDSGRCREYREWFQQRPES
jgi:uncharacterized protein (TIGR02246 family)